MADISGPVPTLPGSSRRPPADARCDNHPNRAAVARVQGETDSFGAEFHDLCPQCFNTHRQASKQPNPGKCDWCQKDAENLHPLRDFEEGMAGRIYDVCRPCIDREKERLARELFE